MEQFLIRLRLSLGPNLINNCLAIPRCVRGRAKMTPPCIQLHRGNTDALSKLPWQQQQCHTCLPRTSHTLSPKNASDDAFQDCSAFLSPKSGAGGRTCSTGLEGFPASATMHLGLFCPPNASTLFPTRLLIYSRWPVTDSCRCCCGAESARQTCMSLLNTLQGLHFADEYREIIIPLQCLRD
jgi:hypothetical protein